ncbi:NDR1/HIN1-like protein 1 [Linum grandiflorum]
MGLFRFLQTGAEKAYSVLTGEHWHYRYYYNRPSLRKILCWIFIGILILLGITVFIIWAVLCPTKPTFILEDTSTVYAFNTSISNNVLTSNFQVTFSARNPNGRIGIYYDELEVYAKYRNQQITRKAQVDPFYQGHKESNVWSPLVYGNDVPMSPYNAAALRLDQVEGSVLVLIKMDGRVRFKVGDYISRHYSVHVRCQAYIQLGKRNVGVAAACNDAVKYLTGQSCSVTV